MLSQNVKKNISFLFQIILLIYLAWYGVAYLV